MKYVFFPQQKYSPSLSLIFHHFEITQWETQWVPMEPFIFHSDL